MRGDAVARQVGASRMLRARLAALNAAANLKRVAVGSRREHEASRWCDSPWKLLIREQGT